MNKLISVKCPQCSLEFNYYNSEYRPFCSDRCRMIDLGHWVTESYSVASSQPLSEDEIELVLKQRESLNEED